MDPISHVIMDKELVETSSGGHAEVTDWIDFVDDRWVSSYNCFVADCGTLY